MHLEQQRNGAWAEVYSHKRCPGCNTDWTPGRAGYSVGTLPCSCAPPEKAHRILACRTCDVEVYEPAHTPQHGPSASYGRSTHRPVN